MHEEKDLRVPTSHDGDGQNKDIEVAAEKGSPVDEPQQTQTVDSAQQSYLHGWKLVSVLSCLTLVMFLGMLDIAVVGTAIPEITSEFHRLEDVGWYVGAYQLSSAALQPLSGKLFGQLSLKWVFITFFFLFEVGSAVCGAAQSSVVFIIGRVISGLGTSGLANGVITIISVTTAPDKRPFYTSVAMGISMLGIVTGPLVGGALTDHVSWRWCFYINLPVGGVAGICLALTSFPQQAKKTTARISNLGQLLNILDIQGFLLLAPSAIMFLLALQFGSGEYGWSSATVIGLFCGSGVLFIVFMAWEHRKGEDAMIPWHLVRKQVVWATCVNYGFLMTGIVATGIYTPLFFQSVKGLSPTMSAVYLLPAVGSQLSGVVLSGALVVRLRYYIPWAAGGAAINAIASGIISTWDKGSSVAELLCYQILFIGRGAALQMGIIALQNSLPQADIPVASAVLMFCGNMFSAVFIIVASTIFHEALTSEVAAHVPGVTSEQAIAAGGSADAVRALAGGNQVTLDGLLDAYTKGFSHVLYLLAAMSVAGFLTAFGMGWVDLKKKHEIKAESSDSSKA